MSGIKPGKIFKRRELGQLNPEISTYVLVLDTKFNNTEVAYTPLDSKLNPFSDEIYLMGFEHFFKGV